MGSYFKVLKGGILSIVGFIDVDTCVKLHYRAKLCCYQKDVSMKRCA